MRRTAVVAIPAVLGLGLAVGLGVDSARAECAMPIPAMSAEAIALPPNPVIYRFESSYSEPTNLRIEGPDGITLDIRLPDMDGWRILDLLKHDSATRHIPVTLKTAMRFPSGDQAAPCGCVFIFVSWRL